LALRQIRREARRADVGKIDIHAGAGLEHIDREQPDHQRQRGQHLEIDQRLERHAPDFGHVRHAGNAVHDRAENDRRDKDADGLDEGVAERLHAGAGFGIEMAERAAERHRDQHQKPKLQVEWLRRLGLGQVGSGCVAHLHRMSRPPTPVAPRSTAANVILLRTLLRGSAAKAQPPPRRTGKDGGPPVCSFISREKPRANKGARQALQSRFALKRRIRPRCPCRYSRA
jgi:hypothetical protein